MAIQDLGDNVRRLMKLQELTIPALAERIGMGTASISNLLNGKSEPKSSTLIALSRGLGVSIQDLLADVPRLSSLRFRTNRTLSAREKAERDQMRHLTARWLADYQYLEEVLDQPAIHGLSKFQKRDPRDAAAEVRQLLGLADKPISDVVELVTSLGIKLRVTPFGFKKTFGLSVGVQDGGPAIVVNSESGVSVERQIFTIVHELGHLLLHSSSYGTGEEIETKQEEDEANSFAGQLLLPDEGLRQDWEACRGIHWVDAVLRIKKKYKVSYLTVLVRLAQISRGLAFTDLLVDFSVAFKRKYKHDLKDHYEPEAIEGPVASTEEDGLSVSDLAGDRFSRMVLEALEKGEISIGRAAEMVGCSLDDMRSVVKDWQDL